MAARIGAIAHEGGEIVAQRTDMNPDGVGSALEIGILRLDELKFRDGRPSIRPSIPAKSASMPVGFGARPDGL
jgi:hypothetical protein